MTFLSRIRRRERSGDSEFQRQFWLSVRPIFADTRSSDGLRLQGIKTLDAIRD